MTLTHFGFQRHSFILKSDDCTTSTTVATEHVYVYALNLERILHLMTMKRYTCAPKKSACLNLFLCNWEKQQGNKFADCLQVTDDGIKHPKSAEKKSSLWEIGLEHVQSFPTYILRRNRCTNYASDCQEKWLPRTSLCSVLLNKPRRTDRVNRSGRATWYNKFYACTKRKNSTVRFTKTHAQNPHGNKSKWKVSPQERVDTDASPTSKPSKAMAGCMWMCMWACVHVWVG